MHRRFPSAARARPTRAGSATAILAGMALCAALPALAAPQIAIETRPGDGAGAYRTHRYQNLFVERLARTPDEVHAKIDAAFQQLFHGDGQEQRLYFETGANANGTLAYITDWANNDARSEGMSYGMMIAVQLGRKREFDALWNWSQTYMLVTDPKDPSVGYFAWSMNTDGTPRSTGAAPDGEEYYVMALYFAAHRWGNGKGIYDYQAQADRILRGMRHHPLLTGLPPFRIHPDDPPFVQPKSPWPSPNNRREMAEAAALGKPWPPVRPQRAPQPVTVGPMVDEANTLIRFVPETDVPGTDASYHLPGFYELWARWGPRGGSRLLGPGGRCQSRAVRDRDRPGNRPLPGPQQLGHVTAAGAGRPARAVQLRQLAHRQQLVGRLQLVAQGCA